MKELKALGLIFAGSLVLMQVLFYKEGFFVNLRVTVGLFWLFVLPGIAVMHYWHEKMGFLSRLLIGIAVSVSVLGIGSYYLGLLGVNIKYHSFIFPPVMMLTGIYMRFR